MSKIGWADGQCRLAAIMQKYLTSECNDRSVRELCNNVILFNVKQQTQWKAFIKLWQKSSNFCLIFISMSVRSIIRYAVILLLKVNFTSTQQIVCFLRNSKSLVLITAKQPSLVTSHTNALVIITDKFISPSRAILNSFWRADWN